MFRSLRFKWTATLVITSLIGVVLVGIFASQTTLIQFDLLRFEQAQAAFVDDVTSYYQQNESWDGVDEWLLAAMSKDFQIPDGENVLPDNVDASSRDDASTDVPPKDSTVTDGEPDFHNTFDRRSPPNQFALADSSGTIIFGVGPFELGDNIDTAASDVILPISLDGQQIGSVLTATPAPELDPREQRYVDATNQALLIGALGAGLTSLVIGLFLSRQFLRPLSDLTQAITAMQGGDLDQRVKIRTQDELGTLAQAFNEMSAKLARANQLRKQMTADIAHDLRTPLTVIGGYLEALRDGTLKPTPERFRVMSEEVSLLHRLVEDLRTLSLADSGELKLMRATVPPIELLQRVSNSFQETASANEIDLSVDTSDVTSSLWIDTERMVQVLGNLVTNALRHTPAQGSIALTAVQKPDAIEIGVRDTGSGIASEDLNKIFDRFYRSDPSRHADSGESGLGLAIAKSIVEAHGGSIRVESEVGVGTTFLIRLPISTEVESSPSDRPRQLQSVT